MDECVLAENETGTNDDAWCVVHNSGANGGDHCRAWNFHNDTGWGR